MQRRTMPICFNTAEYKMIEQYAKKHRMVNTSQAIEKILSEIQIHYFSTILINDNTTGKDIIFLYYIKY